MREDSAESAIAETGMCPTPEFRQELLALTEWEEADFECPTQIEIDAVAHRIIRMAELLRRVREIAQRN